MEKISLAVMRMQPLHNGHKLLIESMLENYDKVIVAIGSTQVSRSEKNPYTYLERKEMVKRTFPNQQIYILPLIDIGASKKEQWTEYVLDEVERRFNLQPTDYFTGSKEDAFWFEGTLPVHTVCRETKGEGINATEIRRRIKTKESLFGIIPKEVQEYIKGIKLWA